MQDVKQVVNSLTIQYNIRRVRKTFPCVNTYDILQKISGRVNILTGTFPEIIWVRWYTNLKDKRQTSGSLSYMTLWVLYDLPCGFNKIVKQKFVLIL
jgi:hypothetical protein